jgi:hypothetical protein
LYLTRQKYRSGEAAPGDVTLLGQPKGVSGTFGGTDAPDHPPFKLEFIEFELPSRHTKFQKKEGEPNINNIQVNANKVHKETKAVL